MPSSRMPIPLVQASHTDLGNHDWTMSACCHCSSLQNQHCLSSNSLVSTAHDSHQAHMIPIMLKTLPTHPHRAKPPQKYKKPWRQKWEKDYSDNRWETRNLKIPHHLQLHRTHSLLASNPSMLVDMETMFCSLGLEKQDKPSLTLLDQVPNWCQVMSRKWGRRQLTKATRLQSHLTDLQVPVAFFQHGL